ncbi:hypothetical protein FJW05_21750 [Mesorhizobium sp. B2-9-1]|nr:hypothetical protein FJW05_21750 [Mesorhizobium sp. B2-9-1]TPJ22183.1 hypothetical protein FJ425_24505 [Mesorhizobium sp. B2-7-2]
MLLFDMPRIPQRLRRPAGNAIWSVFLEQFSVSRNRRTALNLCFCAIPDGKPLRTFPGIALAQASEKRNVFRRLAKRAALASKRRAPTERKNN